MQFPTIATILAALSATNVLAAPVADAMNIEARGESNVKYCAVPHGSVPDILIFHHEEGKAVRHKSEVFSLLGLINLFEINETEIDYYEQSGYDIVQYRDD